VLDIRLPGIDRMQQQRRDETRIDCDGMREGGGSAVKRKPRPPFGMDAFSQGRGLGENIWESSDPGCLAMVAGIFRVVLRV
jgi:hypothetical protein